MDQSLTVREAPKERKPIGRKPKPVTCDRCNQEFPSSTARHDHKCPAAKMGRPPRKPAEPALDAHPKGYSKIYVGEDRQDLAEPVTTETERRGPRPVPIPIPSLEVALPSNLDQRKMIDEYGELDRRKQLHAADEARYETLKRAIKGWFDQAPADADGIVEGDLYRLHLSARERERKIRDMKELADVIGIEKLLELASVALTALENIMGKARVDALTVEVRSGSRRIKAVPKHPAGAA